MFGRTALLLFTVGLTGVSALSETFSKPLSADSRQNLVSQSPTDRLDTNDFTVVDVDPTTCPTIRCAAGFLPVYHEDTKHCSCVSNASPCSNGIICASGSHTVLQPSKDICTCEPDAGTETCPKMKCRAGQHVVYHNETTNCGCETDCPAIPCPAERHPVYDFETHSCSCQLVSDLKARVELKARNEATTPGLDFGIALSVLDDQIDSKTIIKTTYTGPWTKRDAQAAPTNVKTTYTGPYTKRDVADSTALQNPGGPMIQLTTAAQNPGGPMIAATTVSDGPIIVATATDTMIIRPTPFKPLPGHNCISFVCSSEMYAAYDPDSKVCQCKLVSPSLSLSLPWGPMLSARDTTFVTSTTRSPKPTTCPVHNTMCEIGKQPAWNNKNGRCECMDFPSHSNQPHSATSTTSSPIASITPQGCQELYCISEKQPEWNATLGACSCVWIDGFGPDPLR